jgi:hypothetical protein
MAHSVRHPPFGQVKTARGLVFNGLHQFRRLSQQNGEKTGKYELQGDR